MNLRIAGAQISVGLDIADNVATIERAIDYARDEKAEILLTPEGSLSGYTHQFDSELLQPDPILHPEWNLPGLP